MRGAWYGGQARHEGRGEAVHVGLRLERVGFQAGGRSGMAPEDRHAGMMTPMKEVVASAVLESAIAQRLRLSTHFFSGSWLPALCTSIVWLLMLVMKCKHGLLVESCGSHCCLWAFYISFCPFRSATVFGMVSSTCCCAAKPIHLWRRQPAWWWSIPGLS